MDIIILAKIMEYGQTAHNRIVCASPPSEARIQPER